MSGSGQSGEPGRRNEATLKGFDALALYLDQSVSSEGPSDGGQLFGAVYLLPDRETEFGKGDVHPWVVIRSAAPGRPRITFCPRTTLDVHRRGPGFLYSAAGALPRLNRDGLFLLKVRRDVQADGLKAYEYLGLLPEDCCERLKRALDALTAKLARQSGEL